MASNNNNNLNDNQPELAGAGPPEPPVPVPVPPPPPPNDAMMVLKASLVDSKDEDSIACLVMEKHEGDGWAKALEVSAKWWEAFRPATTANSTWISLGRVG